MFKLLSRNKGPAKQFTNHLQKIQNSQKLVEHGLETIVQQLMFVTVPIYRSTRVYKSYKIIQSLGVWPIFILIYHGYLKAYWLIR